MIFVTFLIYTIHITLILRTSTSNPFMDMFDFSYFCFETETAHPWQSLLLYCTNVCNMECVINAYTNKGEREIRNANEMKWQETLGR